MATLPGRCTNDMFCSIAASGDVVRVPAEGKYVCPQCGRTLVSPTTPIKSRRRRRARLQIIPLALVVGGFVGGMVIGGVFVWSPSGNVTILSARPLRAATIATSEDLLQPLPLTVTFGGRSRPHRHRRPDAPAESAAPPPD